LGKLLSWNRFLRCTVKIRENSQSIFLIFDFLCICPDYIQTFIRFALFDLSNRRSSKKLTFVSCSVLTDFCHYLCLPLDRFLFEFFWSRDFWGSCYSIIFFICGFFELKPEPKGLIYYYVYANITNRIVWSFVWKEVFKCRDWRMMRWDEEWTKAQAWGCPCHPKKYPRGTSVKAWGFPRGTPSSSAIIRSPFNTLYFYCFIFYAFFLEHLYFCFQFYFVLFATINGWTPTNFFWRRYTCFSLPRTL
jgi:hypothetical protein